MSRSSYTFDFREGTPDTQLVVEMQSEQTADCLHVNSACSISLSSLLYTVLKLPAAWKVSV